MPDTKSRTKKKSDPKLVVHTKKIGTSAFASASRVSKNFRKFFDIYNYTNLTYMHEFHCQMGKL